MKKIMTIREFLHREPDISFVEKAKRNIKRNKSFYIAVGSYTLIFLCMGVDASAASNIDIKAGQIYKQLVGVGKWIIVVKGAMDIIKSATDGDFSSVKTKLMGYLITFLILLGLPWAFERIEEVFNEAK